MSTSSPFAAVDIELHSQAAQRARQTINEFAVALIMQAKTLAYSRRASQVLPEHIDEAIKVLKLKRQRSWTRDGAVILGSALFGAFVQGFISEVASGQAYLVALYAGLGLIGLLVALWGLRR